MAGDHQAMRKDWMSQKDHRAGHNRSEKSKTDSSLRSGEVWETGTIDLEVCVGGRMIEPSSHFLHGIEKDGVTPEQRMLILQHQIGEAGYAIMKSRRFPDDEAGYLAFAKLGVADAMVQIEMLCLDLGWKPEEIKKMGIQHTWERFRDFEAKGWK